MNYSLMIRPKESPPVRVLEVDGPKRKYVQRGEGYYYLATDNLPISQEYMRFGCNEPDERLVDWDEPHWEIYKNHDGSVEIHACRPTYEEICSGDTLGEFGSIIRLRFAARHTVNFGRWVARLPTKCDPCKGILIPEFVMCCFTGIESDIPIYTTNENPPFQRDPRFGLFSRNANLTRI